MGCRNEPISFSGTQLDNGTAITQWNWQFGDGSVSQEQNPVHTFIYDNNDSTSLTVINHYGCVSDTVKKLVFINYVTATAAPSDTIVARGDQFRLSVSSVTNVSPPGNLTV
ncbi:MAG: PKD domain-containing protein [Bacteroidota bacterium]